jgi:hypothetical protein
VAVDQTDEDISKALKLIVRQQIAAHAIPDVIQVRSHADDVYSDCFCMLSVVFDNVIADGV